MKNKYIDQIGKVVKLNSPPKRIISVVPSQTELLFDLGLSEEIVGITKFCIHPEKWFRTKRRVGGTKNLKIEEITALKPDLILANKEENDKEQIEKLAKLFPVWTSNIKTVEDAFDMIYSIGEITNYTTKAKQMITNLKFHFDSISRQSYLSCAYIIWKDPIMVCGGDTFINSMLEKAGFKNVFISEDRYPIVTDNLLKEKCPQYILLSSEPFPFKQKHIKEFKIVFPKSKIVLVDGEIFSWYGSRMKMAIPYFNKLQKEINSYNKDEKS